MAVQVRGGYSNNNNGYYDHLQLGRSSYMDQQQQYGYGSSMYLTEHTSLLMMEKRQLFLRSYQFCRKKSVAQRIKACLKRVVLRLRVRSVVAAKQLKIRVVWSRLRHALYSRRRKRFLRLHLILLPHNSSSNSCSFW